MTKGRTTTYEERIEIVSFCIERGNDYTATIEKYGVSYQQIYSWVRKYNEKGAEGPVDKAAQGLDIRVMYDDMGSISTFNMDNVRQLRSKGIKCVPFNPLIAVKGTVNCRGCLHLKLKTAIY